MKNEAELISNYSMPVHKGIMRRDLVMGVPFVPFVIIALVTLTMVVICGIWQIIPFSVVILVAMREISKNDEYLLEIFLSSLMQPDILD